jgi:Trp operon repressor
MANQSPSSGDGPGGIPVGGSDGRSLAIHVVTRLLGLGIVFGLGYLTRPIWHGLVYSVFYSPGMAIFGGGAALAALALWFLPPFDVDDDTNRSFVRVLQEADSPVDILLGLGGSPGRKLRLFVTVVGVLAVLSILISIPAGMLEQRTLAQQTMSEASEVEEFPQANPENPRVVPRQVADITTRGSVSYRQYRLGASDIARMENGSLAWSYAIQPDGFRNALIEHQRGVLVTDMTRMDDRQIKVYEEQFTYGEGMLLHRSADWNLKKTDYFAKYNDDAVEFSHDGRPYMYYPKTGHEWHLTPLPHTTPTWDGGALLHPDGEVEHLSPEEARSNPILDGQRLYPLTLTRDETGSLGYRNGIINQLPTVGAHEGQIEVAGLPSGANNAQPFVIDLEGERMSYVTAMEPYGEDTRGLDEVWFVDAETGEYTFFGTDDETLTGPERAMGIARSADSRTNWGQNFVVTEPVPVTIDGDLWWHIKVSPTDFTDVTRNVFVNADTSRTVEIRDDEAVRSFVAGSVDDEALQPVDEDDDDQDVVYYILVTDENGDVVERIPVERGQDTTIVDPDDERAQGNETAAG